MTKRDIKAKRWERRKLKRAQAILGRDYKRYLVFKTRGMGWTGFDIGGGDYGNG